MLRRLGVDAEVVKAMALLQLRKDQEASGEGITTREADSNPHGKAAATASAGQKPVAATAATAGRQRGGQRRGGKAKGDGRALAQFCRDLCAEARAGRLDPVREEGVSEEFFTCP